MVKIALMGTGYKHKQAGFINFITDDSILDYDILIWNPDGTTYPYTTGLNLDGYMTLDQRNSSLFSAILNRRQKELEDMLKLGRTVIIHNSYPPFYYLPHGDLRNVLQIIPGLSLEVNNASGRNLEFKGTEPFTSFWKINQGFFRYRSYFSSCSGKPLFFIEGTPFVVGFHADTVTGNLIFVPALAGDIFGEDASSMIDTFISSVEELVRNLHKSTGIFELPLWSLDYSLPNENEMRKSVLSLEEELETVRQKIAKEQDLIAELERDKVLFLGSGRMLEIQVKKVLEELGFMATEGLSGRDDLILKYGDRVAVVEVKGVAKSAAESHAAQLEKWVSDYLITKSIQPKGILIVNSFKDTPLIDRKESAFPNQMLEYAKKREHCLITGLQLLGMYIDCRDHPEKKPALIERMFATVGIFSEYQDWTRFLSTKAEITR